MEFANINSIRATHTGPKETRDLLIERHANSIPEGHVLTTAYLELLRGEEIIKKARQNGDAYVPVQTVHYHKGNVGFPNRVILEMTSICNTFCTMCPRNELTRKFEHMETPLIKDIISQLAEVGLRQLLIYNIGESMIHPDFFEVVDFCRQYDNLGPIWVSTNGGIMNDRMIENVLTHPVDIFNYSVNAMSEGQFKKLNPGTKFDKMKKNLDKLLKRKQELNVDKPIIRAQMIGLPKLQSEVEEFKKEYGGRADTLSINRLEVFSQNIDANKDHAEDYDFVVNTNIPKCNRIARQDLFISSDGKTTVCDTDFNNTLNLGNVREKTVKEIFNGGGFSKLVKQMEDGTLVENKVCSTCRDWDL